MKNVYDENLVNKEGNHANDESPKLPNISNRESPKLTPEKNRSEKDSQDKKDKSPSSVKLKITEHYEIKSKENTSETQNISNNKEENQFEKDKNIFINDFYSEESERNSPKIIDGKTAIDINEIIGEDTKQPIIMDMIDDPSITLTPGKISAKSFGLITSYAANTNQGIVRDYNEDRVSVIINMNKPKYYTSPLPWPKLSYFGVFDGHAGNKCAEFLRDNLLNYICNNSFFPNDIPNAIKFGFKSIDDDYLKNHAFINNKLVDNSGSCGLILLLINNLIYIANVGDSRCLGSFKNGKIQKDITLDHKPNTPYEKERIIKNGGKIYQTQTPIEDDETFKDKILVGPYRVFPGKLSVSRTVGDAEGKIEALGGNPNVIVPVPDIFCFDLEKDDIDFFILGCDGIYDQLYSKDIFKCAWMVLNNNLDLYKKHFFSKDKENIFKGNYGNIINMNTTSGNIVDFILKASMIRKSFDNVTCLFISFKNFFENLEKTIQNKLKENKNINIKINEHKINKDILLRNKSNYQKDNFSRREPQIIFKERNKSERTLTKDNNVAIFNNKDKNGNLEEDKDILNKNKISLNMKKVKGTYNANKKRIRINSLPKQPLFSIKSNKSNEDTFSNINTTQTNNKNMTVNNIITYNNNIYLNSEDSRSHNDMSNQASSFNDKIMNHSNSNTNKNSNLHIIHSPLIKDNKGKNNNILANSSNQLFFTKMHITGINLKNKNKKEMSNNQIIKNNLNNNNNNEESYRHTSYAKKVRPIYIDNDMGLLVDNSKKDKYYLGSPNGGRINYKKINEVEYKNNFGNNDNNVDNNKNIRSNSHNNNDYNKINIKPIILKSDKNPKLNNNFKNCQSNHNIKFNNIIKTNNYGIINNKQNFTNNINNNNNNENNYLNLKNITLAKLKAKKKEEIKIKKPMPTLGHLQMDKNNNKLIEENNFLKQRRFATNDGLKRKSNLSEHKKLGGGNYKIELNVSNKNNSGKENKINNIYNKNADINGTQLNSVKNIENNIKFV